MNKRSTSYLQRKQTGRRAEQLAADFLMGLGYRIVETNWHHRLGELDIIAMKESMYIFVEVRSKTASSMRGNLLESLPVQKRQQVRRLVELYLQLHRFNPMPKVRLDAIFVEFHEIKQPCIIHIENAF